MNVILPNGSLCNIERYAAACQEVGLDPIATGGITPEEFVLRQKAIDLATIGKAADPVEFHPDVFVDHDFRDAPRIV